MKIEKIKATTDTLEVRVYAKVRSKNESTKVSKSQTVAELLLQEETILKSFCNTSVTSDNIFNLISISGPRVNNKLEDIDAVYKITKLNKTIEKPSNVSTLKKTTRKRSSKTNESNKKNTH